MQLKDKLNIVAADDLVPPGTKLVAYAHGLALQRIAVTQQNRAHHVSR